ncbi:hypothetical protein NPIL_641491 [Nephila pilipes]|uniref:Uncharacterized protein n=1 Tax=Nephila pilipes TaxID=299642 RepID=A0A8X6MS97_NEPPI|nr:hypothetical protein NPIL_641491 [Nephila pilipes]
MGRLKHEYYFLKHLRSEDLLLFQTLSDWTYLINKENVPIPFLPSLNAISLLKGELSDLSALDDSYPLETLTTDFKSMPITHLPTVSNKSAEVTFGSHGLVRNRLDGSSKNLLALADVQQDDTSFNFFGMKDDLIKPFSSRDNYSVETFISDIEGIFN